MAEQFFMGKNGYVWWFGKVESNGDPMGLGRCRVRIDGWHNEDDTQLPTEALPWAYPAHSLDGGSTAGVGKSGGGPQPGTKVHGFFLDGELGQQPIMLHVIPGMGVAVSNKAVEYGSTPFQPTMTKIMNTIIGREGDCPDGYEADTTRANRDIPDQSKLPISSGDWVLPFTGFVSSAYGEARGTGTHHGVDICTGGFFPQTDPGNPHLNGRLRGPVGLPVFAAADGEVVFKWTANKGQGGVPTSYDKDGRGSRSYGNAIAIRHNLSGKVYTTVYAHLGVTQDAGKDVPGAGINVSVGQKVSKGQQIGIVGRSHVWDAVTHLHFEIRIGEGLPKANNHINPGRVFPQLLCRHQSMRSWVDAQTKYNVAKLPFEVSEAPIVARAGPKE